MRILCIGHEWRGSNSSALFYALSRQGCLTNIVNEQAFVSTLSRNFFLKVILRILRIYQVREFNFVLKEQYHAFKPDIVLVYKGTFVMPSTIRFFKKNRTPVISFYPDVSFKSHGPYIPKCLPLYDHVFSTKTFSAKDLYYHFNYPSKRVTFIPHGFDPQIHRPINFVVQSLKCDVSFIGTFSAHKAFLLERLIVSLPDLSLKIWGNGWEQYKGKLLGKSIQGQPVFGDVYSAAINSSLINLGILSECVFGASSGDLITSRTFHIPAAGGFMLHQRTEESVQYFRENEEAVFFNGPDELVEKVKYYLIHHDERIKIAKQGHERSVREYSLDSRANSILTVLRKQNLI